MDISLICLHRGGFNISREGRQPKSVGANCCDMDQSDTIGKIELFPSIVLSTRVTNWKNDIHKFL